MNDQPQKEGRGRLWLAIGLVVAATLAAVLMVPDEEPAEVEAIPAPVVSPPPATAPAEPEAPPPAESAMAPEARKTESPATETAVSSSTGPEGSAARAWLAAADNPSPAELAAKALQFQRMGQVADAWLLYFKAAREGDAGAAMALAEQADPVFFDPARSALEKPDLVQAHKWYSRAAELGAAGAVARLEQLLKQVEKRAVAGDERAALLLEEWRSK